MVCLVNAWVEHAEPEDTSQFTRWFDLTTTVELDDGPVVLLRRVLGWDGSEPPDWATPRPTARVRVDAREVVGGGLLDCLGESTRRAIDSGVREVRRVLLPAQHWARGLSSGRWGLHVPTVVYELWAEQHARCGRASSGVALGRRAVRRGLGPRRPRVPGLDRGADATKPSVSL